MKIRLIVWLGVELLVASGISLLTCFIRPAEVQAVRAWHDNPTVETRSELDRQRHITTLQQVLFAGVLFTGMAVISIPVVAAVSRRQNPRFESQTHRAD